MGERALAFESSDGFVTDYRIVRPDGNVREVQSRAIVTRGASGEPARLTGTIQDLTDQRAAERLKDSFVSLISHELRTPLTSIKGALGLLASGSMGPMSDQGQRMLDVAVASTDFDGRQDAPQPGRIRSGSDSPSGAKR